MGGEVSTRASEAAVKGVVFLGDRKLELRELPDPTPGPRDVSLEIKASGTSGIHRHNYRAAALSCGTGTAWGALRGLTLQGGETIAIFGQGPVGLSATQFAVVMGARVIAVDIAPERRKLAQQFGAHEVIDPEAGDMVAAIRDLTHGEGAHQTLHASSAPEARAAAVPAVRPSRTPRFVGARGH